MILPDTRSTSYDLASLFRGRPNTLEGWDGRIAKRSDTKPSVLRIDTKPSELLRFWICELPFCEEGSQTCYVLVLSTSTFQGNLAQFLPFR